MNNAPTSILDRLRARAATPVPQPTADLSKRGTPAGLEGPPTVQPADSPTRLVHAAPVMVQTAFGEVPIEPGNELPAPAAALMEERAKAAQAAAAAVAPGQINPPEFQRAPTATELAAQNAKPAPAPAAEGARIRRTKEEIAAGLSVEQARAARAGAALVADVRDVIKEAYEATLAGHMAPKPAAADAPAPSQDTTPVVQAARDIVQNVDASPAPCRYVETTGADGEVLRTRVPGPAKPIPVLFVNCLPLTGTYVLASSLASAANARICADQKIADYRYIQYGAGPGCLRAAVMEQIDGAENCPPIMVDTSTPEGSALVTDLEARAAQVVRGLR